MTADLTGATTADTPADRAAAGTGNGNGHDVAEFSGGVSSDERHAALRASVRRLGELLGEALTRHEGAELLALVEQVRRAGPAPDDGAELAALLSRGRRPHRDRAGPRVLRVLPARQHHRAAAPLAGAGRAAAQPAGRDRTTASRPRWHDGHAGRRSCVRRSSRRLELRPVFTAHPTEASRRSVLDLLRRIADAGRRRARTRGGAPADAERDRAPARRGDRPALADRRAAGRAARSRRDEARSASTTCETLASERRPRPAGGPRPRSCAGVGVAPARRRPGRCGSARWAGGDRDGNPNVTPAVTLEVLDAAARLRAAGADRRGRRPGRWSCRASTRVVAGQRGRCRPAWRRTARRCRRSTTRYSG